MRRPLVSVVIPAFNLARFLPAALDSALAQSDPGGPVEVIVIDDGSTDETPAVLGRYGDRIRALRQPNGGLTAAVQRGLQEATGEFIALLDADDEWPPTRLARHVRILRDAPCVGLVHGDMELIDAEGRVTHPSFFGRERMAPTGGRLLGKLIALNHIAGGASTFRTSLLPALAPFEPMTAYPDWRIAVGAAAVAEIAFDPVSANRYRSHGANMGLDATPDMVPVHQRQELPFRRWLLSEFLDDPTITIDEIHHALLRWRDGVVAASATTPGGGVRELFTTDPRLIAARPAERDWRRPGSSLAARVRTLMRDPFDGAAAFDLDRWLAFTPRPPRGAPEPPLVALDRRPAMTLAGLEQLMRRPALLEAYADEVGGDDDTTLVILAEAGGDVGALVDLVARSPRLSAEDIDLQVLGAPATPPARALLRAWASARLTAIPGPEYAALEPHPAVERVREPAHA